MVAPNVTMTKTFIPPQRDIRLIVTLTGDQARAVRALVFERFPALRQMHQAGTLQTVNGAGQFRLAGVRGGQLPAEVTRTEVAHLVQAVLDSQPAALVDPAFDEESRRYAGRARR